MAALLPARTLNSGPTNSMYDSAFLVKEQKGVARDGKETEERENISVVVIWWHHSRLWYAPRSIGPKPSSSSGKVTIGPDYVGHRVQQSATVFGGTTPPRQITLSRHKSSAVNSEFTLPASVHAMLERLIDTMKTNAEDVTVLLVGSSAVLVPVDEGESASAEFAGWRMRLGLVPWYDMCSMWRISRESSFKKWECIISEVDLEWISAGCYILGTARYSLQEVTTPRGKLHIPHSRLCLFAEAADASKYGTPLFIGPATPPVHRLYYS
ncbi:uncharacterized protein STEHIDRAFT_113739 [Stereum hirsutum FP-91666 SS1]|uniref:uncharacterized protein n=1 Tax=Stereum hirsutum (strain FP-91666) TaxID=721885 RepID=UPI0004449A4B|nr:uncharacterized protein STEHIDRAFT_113739 [Stereum hirsutum FP-91666 SS1]EIM83668.1 hypothetical protein STEHIDRAFT_113739 [Stereum hirsutum FP-91666 SS1]